MKSIGITLLARLSTHRLESFVFRLVAKHSSLLSADDALKFLFRLDNRLYKLQSKTSVAYNGGTHPKHRHTRYHDFFSDRIRAGERVLDVGCGRGALAFDVADKTGARVIGIDINEANIDFACRHYQHPRVEYRVGDVLRDLGNDDFDVVILSNIIEHLKDRSLFLEKIKKEIQPTCILIRVPLFERDWRVPLKKELGVEWRLDSTHETEYTLKEFNTEICMAGLKVRYCEIRWGEIWAEVIDDAS